MRTINNISAFLLACSLLLAGLPLSIPAFGQNNYIRICTPTTPLPPGSTLNMTNSIVTTSYYNSAGQLVQEVNHAATPQRKDQANLIVYDGLGRKTKEWQSVPFSDSDGSYKPIDRFNSSYAGFYHLDYKYEPSALRRPTEEIGRNSVGKGIQTEYLLNTDQYEELKVYRYSAYSNSDELYREGTYPEGSLTCVKTTDEDSNANYLFYDSADRLILERRYDGDEQYDTYYVYSPWDDLICVLPPLASDGLADGRYNLENTEVLKKYAYIYKYDRNGHRTGRKLPGAEWCYTIYDGDHRPVLEQTKKLYEKMAWTFRKYDGLGRIIIEGTAHEATYSEYLVDRYANILMKESYVGSSTAGDKYGYSGNAGPGTLRSLNPTVVYYYDTYDFLDLPLFGPLASATAPENGHAANMLPTGKYIATLDGSGGHELQVYYYDARGRMVQTDKYNSISRTTSHTATEYNFMDSPLEIADRYVTPDVTAQRSITYQYDAAGRETASNMDVSLQTAEGGTINKSYPLQQNSYDEFGRLQSKQLLNDKDVVTMDYGQDGKLHELNNRHFSQKLHYSELDARGKHYYNGLISGLSIHQGGNSYRFELDYDALGRYVSSGMYDYEGNADIGWSEFFQYDKMGNMNMIGHSGPLGPINFLSLNYDGNHVNGVNNHNSYQYPPYEYAHMFCDWYSQPKGYAYDGNGNEVKNMAAGIYHARYNDLNLPDSVLFRYSGNTANFTYLGDGRRIRSVYKTYNGGLAYILENNHVFNDPNYVYEEVKDGDLEFEDGKLTKMNIPNGYIKTVGDNGGYTLDARYFLTDYLGSIRTVCDSQSGNALDNIEYLPSGMAFRTSWLGEQNLRFCGKEELTMHGYNVYDSGARFQYSRYPRFLSMDPLAEKYYSWSPYAYCMGNPVNAIDPGGRLVIFVNGMHNGFEGASSSYWSMKGERPVGFDTAVMAHFGDWNDKYYDGSIGGSFGALIGNISPFKRDEFGYKTGEVDAASIIAGLARNDKGEITETIKVIAHSMGAAYAKGLIRALVEYARRNPELCTGLSISEYDFAPFQPTSQRAVNGVSTFQYSHSDDEVAEYIRMPGAEFMDTRSDRNQGHPISTFYDLIRNLPEGKYVFVSGMPLKVN